MLRPQHIMENTAYNTETTAYNKNATVYTVITLSIGTGRPLQTV